MSLTHILVDFDNTQPSIAELAQLSGASQRLWIFTSPHSGKFIAAYVQALLAHDGRAKLVHCTKAGNNAVDLHIALHLGRLIADRAVAGAPTGDDDFVVVSADKDFVPVLEFVRALGHSVRQVKSLKAALGVATSPPRMKKADAAAPIAATPKATIKKAAKPAAAVKVASKAAAAKLTGLDALFESLRKSPSNRPATVVTLGKWLVARKLPAAEVEVSIERLAAAGVLRVDGKKVIYAPEPWPATLAAARR